MMVESPVAIELDASHPTLDDHRPGGLPLFGTALSIETLCKSLLRDKAAGDIVAIEQIEMRAPCILDNGERRNIFASCGPVTQDARGGYLAGRLFSRTQTGGETLHLRSIIRLCGAASLPAVQRDLATMQDEVTAQDIYRVYFHGRSFQVIAAGQFHPGMMTCRLSEAPQIAVLPVIARLIELGLQSAGLLELAETGRMMIPHAIRAIHISGAAINGPVYARACRCVQSIETGDIDITVVGRSGSALAFIQGYQTTPLPFVLQGDMVQALAGRLNRR